MHKSWKGHVVDGGANGAEAAHLNKARVELSVV